VTVELWERLGFHWAVYLALMALRSEAHPSRTTVEVCKTLKSGATVAGKDASRTLAVNLMSDSVRPTT
jgi:hypothetical protein